VKSPLVVKKNTIKKEESKDNKEYQSWDMPLN
jgi:hypothetical protein